MYLTRLKISQKNLAIWNFSQLIAQVFLHHSPHFTGQALELELNLWKIGEKLEFSCPKNFLSSKLKISKFSSLLDLFQLAVLFAAKIDAQHPGLHLAVHIFPIYEKIRLKILKIPKIGRNFKILPLSPLAPPPPPFARLNLRRECLKIPIEVRAKNFRVFSKNLT